MTTAPPYPPVSLTFDFTSFLTQPTTHFPQPPQPTSSNPDTTSSSMTPRQEPPAPPRRSTPQASTASSNEDTTAGALVFITANNMGGFRTASNRTIIRKKAMASHLDSKDSKKSKSSTDPSRHNSPASNASRSSGASNGNRAEPSSVSSTVAQSAASLQTTLTIPSSSGASQSVVARGSSVAIGKFPIDVRPIVERSRSGPLPYDGYTPPPFVSIGKAIDPFRTMFQASHPHISVEELKFHCSRYFGTKSLGMHWIPTALSHTHTFLGTLCLATAYRDVVQERPRDSLQTTALRQEVLHLVGRNIRDAEAKTSDHNLMAIIQLIISEVIIREESGLGYHENAIEIIINERGGLNQLGMNGYLASAIGWISLASSILKEKEPRRLYTDHCLANSAKRYLDTQTIPESPIYCPRDAFKTLERSTACDSKTLALVNDIRKMLNHFVVDAKHTRRNSKATMALYERITNRTEYPPISDLCKTNVLTESDWRYEAVRIAAVIQATAIINRQTLSEALSLAAAAPLALNTSIIPFRTDESPISPYNTSRVRTDLGQSTSPSYAAFSATALDQHSYFPTTTMSQSSFSSITRPSVSSGARPSSSSMTHPSFSSATRPSISSISDANYPTYSPFTDVHHPSIASMQYFDPENPSSSSMQYFDPENITYFQPPVAPVQSESNRLLRSLKTALENSNLSECWSDMAGVLLWVSIVVGAASRQCNKYDEGRVLRKYFSALTMRTGIMLCFEHPQAINKSMLRMTEVVEALSNPPSPGHGKSHGKKRRV